ERHSSLCPRGGLSLEDFRRHRWITRWRKRNGSDFGFFRSDRGAVCNTVFWICTIHAEIEPFSASFFFVRKRAARLGFSRFVWGGVGLWRRIQFRRTGVWL